MAPNHQSGPRAGRPRSFGTLQLCLVIVSAALVSLVAMGSSRSVARISPAQRLLDVRPALGDLFVLLGAVLVVECALLVYVVLTSFQRRSREDLGEPAEQSGPWQRLLAAFVPLVLIVVLAVSIARRGSGMSTTPGSLGPLPTFPPVVGGSGSGPPLVVHWWIFGGLALLGLAVLVVVLVVRRRRRRQTPSAPAQPEREELRAAIDASLEELGEDGDPRRAVINAYAGMERVLSEHGLPRRPHETPLEYLGRWTAVLHVGRAAAEALAALYERARFSLHLMDEEMRQDAVAALGALRRELGDEPA